MLRRRLIISILFLWWCAGCMGPGKALLTNTGAGTAGPEARGLPTGMAATGDQAENPHEQEDSGDGSSAGGGDGPSGDGDVASPNNSGGKHAAPMHAMGGISGGAVAAGPDPEFQRGLIVKGSQTTVCENLDGKLQVHLRGRIFYGPKVKEFDPIHKPSDSNEPSIEVKKSIDISSYGVQVQKGSESNEQQKVIDQCSQWKQLSDLEIPNDSFLTTIRVIYAKSAHTTYYQDFYLASSWPSGSPHIGPMVAVGFNKPLVFFDVDVVTASPQSIRFLVMGGKPDGEEHICTPDKCMDVPRVCNGLDVADPDKVPSCLNMKARQGMQYDNNDE